MLKTVDKDFQTSGESPHYIILPCENENQKLSDIARTAEVGVNAIFYENRKDQNHSFLNILIREIYTAVLKKQPIKSVLSDINNRTLEM